MEFTDLAVQNHQVQNMQSLHGYTGLTESTDIRKLITYSFSMQYY